MIAKDGKEWRNKRAAASPAPSSTQLLTLIAAQHGDNCGRRPRRRQAWRITVCWPPALILLFAGYVFAFTDDSPSGNYVAARRKTGLPPAASTMIRSMRQVCRAGGACSVAVYCRFASSPTRLFSLFLSLSASISHPCPAQAI